MHDGECQAVAFWAFCVIAFVVGSAFYHGVL
jgi:hypothetical protein